MKKLIALVLSLVLMFSLPLGTMAASVQAPVVQKAELTPFFEDFDISTILEMADFDLGSIFSFFEDFDIIGMITSLFGNFDLGSLFGGGDFDFLGIIMDLIGGLFGGGGGGDGGGGDDETTEPTDEYTDPSDEYPTDETEPVTDIPKTGASNGAANGLAVAVAITFIASCAFVATRKNKEE
ncbi:MAG TPA: hypothetical protein PLA10_05420 [Clostridiales bacterium]|nr:hypothetical protein [Clostridiales bacterium]